MKAVARVLGSIASAEAVPALIQTLQQSHGGRRSAAFALGNIGPDAAAAVPTLIQTLEDNDPRVRSGAVRALRHMGPKAKVSIPRGIERLQDKDRMVRSGAAGVLAEFSSPAMSPAVPALTAALDDEYVYVRTRAAKALGRIGPAAQAAVTELVETLADRSTATSAMRALVQIDADASIPPLVKSLNSPHVFVREEAAELLGTLGPKASDALPRLRRLTTDPNAEVADAARAAIARIENQAK